MSSIRPQELLSRNDNISGEGDGHRAGRQHELHTGAHRVGSRIFIGDSCLEPELFPSSTLQHFTNTHTHTHTADEEQVFAPARGRCKLNWPNPKPVTRLAHIHLHCHATYPPLSQSARPSLTLLPEQHTIPPPIHHTLHTTEKGKSLYKYGPLYILLLLVDLSHTDK